MSKPVKNMIIRTYQAKLAGVDSGVLIEMRGLQSNQNNALRAGLAQKGIKVTILKNSLAKRAVVGSKLEKISDLLQGPCALVYGGDGVVTIARELIEQVKTLDKIQFKGALMEGELFQANEIEALSKYPTRVEAQGQLVALLLSPARNLAGAILGPGRKVASLVKAIEEKLEKGETIAQLSA